MAIPSLSVGGEGTNLSFLAWRGDRAEGGFWGRAGLYSEDFESDFSCPMRLILGYEFNITCAAGAS